MTMQQQLTAGDTLNYQASAPLYPAHEGWTLKLRLVPRAVGGGAIVLTATNDGTRYLVQALAAETAQWAAGEYAWAAWVEKAGERYTVESGQITVLPDPAQIAVGTDTRSAARRALDDARAALQSWNPLVRRYRIGDREREFNTIADLIRFITYLEQQVAVEDRLAGRTEKVGRRIFSRI